MPILFRAAQYNAQPSMSAPLKKAEFILGFPHLKERGLNSSAACLWTENALRPMEVRYLKMLDVIYGAQNYGN